MTISNQTPLVPPGERMACGHARYYLINGTCTACRDEQLTGYVSLREALEGAYAEGHKSAQGIRLTDHMAHVLLAAVYDSVVGKRRYHRAWFWSPSSAAVPDLDALVRQGLADDDGVYLDLTELGAVVHHALKSNPSTRFWSTWQINQLLWADAPNRPASPDRTHTSNQGLTEHVRDFQVKRWYVSGSVEIVSNLGFEAAASAYAGSKDNRRVCAGEVHDAYGGLVAAFTRETVDTVEEHG